MATYKEIQTWMKANHGYKGSSCWIAHRKEVNGIKTGKSAHRRGARKNPCPKSKEKAIDSALRHFKMIK